MAEGPGGLLNPTTLVGTKTEPLYKKTQNERDRTGSQQVALSGQQEKAGTSLTGVGKALGLNEKSDLSGSWDVPGVGTSDGAGRGLKKWARGRLKKTSNRRDIRS